MHNTHFSQFIPPAQINKSAGTWTPTLASNALYERRTAADATFNLFIPIRIPSNSVALQGAKIASIEVIYNITTAACDDFATVELEKMTSSAAGAVTGAAVTVSVDTSHDTAAERKATGTHRMTVTITTPEWVDNDCWYVLYLVVDAAATTVFDLYGAIVNFTLRA